MREEATAGHLHRPVVKQTLPSARRSERRRPPAWKSFEAGDPFHTGEPFRPGKPFRPESPSRREPLLPGAFPTGVCFRARVGMLRAMPTRIGAERLERAGRRRLRPKRASPVAAAGAAPSSRVASRPARPPRIVCSALVPPLASGSAARGVSSLRRRMPIKRLCGHSACTFSSASSSASSAVPPSESSRSCWSRRSFSPSTALSNLRPLVPARRDQSSGERRCDCPVRPTRHTCSDMVTAPDTPIPSLWGGNARRRRRDVRTTLWHMCER